MAQKNDCRDEDGDAGTSATVRQESRGTEQNGSERSHHEGTLENIMADKESTGDEGRYGEAHGHVAAGPETGNPARKPEGAAWEKILKLLPELVPEPSRSGLCLARNRSSVSGPRCRSRLGGRQRRG